MGRGEGDARGALGSASMAVLLVDDDWMGQAVTQAILEELGYRVSVAGSGTEALAAWEQESCDLILMDVQMPEMDGCEATRKIREREAASGGHIPIIALTADTQAGDREACLAAGMDDYVPKPVDPEVVQGAIERVCADAAGAAGSHVDQAAQRSVGEAAEERELGATLAELGFEPLAQADDAGAQADIPEEMLARIDADFAASPPDVVLDQTALENLWELEKRGALSVPKVVALFYSNAERILPALQTALAAGALPELRREAHTLKGNARDVGTHVLANRCAQLEVMARDGKLDGAAELIAEIERVWPEARAAVQGWLQSMGLGEEV